jgi:hypothetical protein
MFENVCHLEQLDIATIPGEIPLILLYPNKKKVMVIRIRKKVMEIRNSMVMMMTRTRLAQVIYENPRGSWNLILPLP